MITTIDFLKELVKEFCSCPAGEFHVVTADYHDNDCTYPHVARIISELTVEDIDRLRKANSELKAIS